MINKKTCTYEPDNSLKNGYLSLLSEIINELKTNQWLTYQLFKRDFSASYKQSMVGVLWIFILPLLNVATFMMLNNSGIFLTGNISIPYPLYAILGLAFWQIFASGVVAAGNSLTQAGEMLTRINMSKKSLVLASMGRSLVAFGIQLLLVVVLCLFYQIVPKPGFIFFPLVVLPIFFLTLGAGLLMAILNAIVRDVGNLLLIGITFLMYLTPVLYARPTHGILAHATAFNPMYYFLSAARDLFLTGTIMEFKGFIVSSVASFVLLLGAFFVFHMTETRIAERI